MGQLGSREKIFWVNDVERAVMIAGLTRKPVFLMILKSLCPTCKNLEPNYIQDKEFRLLSKFFVMARSVDQKQVEESYAVDGHYVPRILFLDSTGKPMEQFCNESAVIKEEKYFYAHAEDLARLTAETRHALVMSKKRMKSLNRHLSCTVQSALHLPTCSVKDDTLHY